MVFKSFSRLLVSYVKVLYQKPWENTCQGSKRTKNKKRFQDIQKSPEWLISRNRDRGQQILAQPCSAPGRGALRIWKHRQAGGMGHGGDAGEDRKGSRCESAHAGSQVGPAHPSCCFRIQRHLPWGLQFWLREGCAGPPAVPTCLAEGS